jgi:hypothetical protein
MDEVLCAVNVLEQAGGTGAPVGGDNLGGGSG